MAARLSLVLSESNVNIINNTSVVTAKLYYYGNGASYNYNNPKGTITIDGTDYSFNHDFTKSTSAQLLATKSKTVTHNADGSKSVSVSASFNTGVSIGTLKTSATLALTKIARASNIALDKTSVLADGTETVVATVTKMLDTYTDIVTVSLGDYSQTFENVEGSVTFAIPEEWINAISSTSATATVEVTSYSGETVIGSNTVNLTVNVPDSVVPTINNVAITEAVAAVANAFSDCFVQNLSQLNVVIDASGAYGSTIRSYSAVIVGVTYIQQAFTSNVLNTAGTLNIAVEVVDSRGRTASDVIPINVAEYASPTITAMTYAHWDSETGKQNSSGDSTKITISGKVSSVEEQNTKTLKLKYKSLVNEDYIERLVPLSDWTFNVDVIINETDPSVTYEYIAELTDKINTDSPATFRVTTGVVVLSRLAGGKGVTLFGEAEEEGFIIKGKNPLLFKDAEALEATKQHLGIGADYIVEEGTTEDGWSYIKYASGWAEMWFRENIGQVTLGTVLGTDIVSNPFSINFPFSFIEVPYCVVTYESNSTGYAGVQMVNGNNTTVSKSYGIRLVRMGNSSIALQDNIVSCYARGRWQTGEETTLTATHDGVGNVTVYGVTATHDGAGNVRIS